MKILALNSGSSSIKYTLFDVNRNYQIILKGTAERIGQENGVLHQTQENKKLFKKELFIPDHQTALQLIYQEMQNAIDLKTHLNAIGHRIVHGGDEYRQPILINEDVVNHLKATAKFAPLHCQPNIIGIEVLQKLLPNLPHVAVFDTAAHTTIEPKAFLYGIPLEYYEKYKIRKYGFHGINHVYVAEQAAKLLKKPLEELKMITCHLGNGCSITAFKQGKSIDNSMGLTPLEGLVMGTRSGDIDPAAVLYLIDILNLTTDKASELLNKKSGLLGLCGKNDMRDITTAASNGDLAAQTAIEIFVYRVQKYIGAYIAALNGVDVIVFTAGIGENSHLIRAQVMQNFTYIGAYLDPEKNQKNAKIFSSDHSQVFLMNIPANEERAIAEKTYHVVSKTRVI